MSKYRIIDDPQRSIWDSFLDKFGCGNIQQSFDFGEVAKMSNPHTRVVRLFAVDGNCPVGLVQARFNRRFGFGDRLEVGGVYGNGPVVANIEDKEQVFRELIADLEKCVTRNRVSEAFIYRLGKDQVLESMGYTLVQVFNVYKVDLQKTADELWRNIAHNKRRNIRKAQEQGVEVVQGTSYDDLVSFYEMHSISGKRAGFIPHPFGYFRSYLKIFGASGKVRIFLAVFDGQRVAGVFVVVHGDTAYALGAGSREEVWHVRPNDMLHWKAMEWACSEGLAWYHMGHVSEPPPTEDSSGWGLWRWKREWNGLLEKTFLYHKIYMPRFRKIVLTPYEKIYNRIRKVGF
jgi:lipid II:glycine glycyltransferase (peptidoglycan interpeptide bridge formation enzyme)